MREIKFRAWDEGIEQWRYFTLDDTLMGRFIRFSLTHFGQYTGLKDKHGNEIYEGDILGSSHGNLGPVQYRAEYAAFGIDWKGVEDADLLHWEELEVIGNIYENPDLITP
jgi:uncharacterized phage protein (TIGR01671 family)